MAWTWLRRLWRPYVSVEDLSALGRADLSRVEIEGRVELLEPLADPISGEPCAAIEYRAWPPSTTIGIDGATSHNNRAYQVNARQAADFVLGEGSVRVLIRVDRGEDLQALHDRMLERYGVGLRAETEVIAEGQRLRVSGKVEHRSGGGTPHRELPYGAIVRAERIRVV